MRSRVNPRRTASAAAPSPAAALASVALAASVCAAVLVNARPHAPARPASQQQARQRTQQTSQPPAASQSAAQPAAQPAAARGRVEYAEFESASLGQRVRYAVSLPASYDARKSRRYPLVVFLHGLNNTERDWEAEGMQARLEALRAEGKAGEFVLAAPFGANSFYLNAKGGAAYEDAIVKDFIPFVEKNYRAGGKAAWRVVEGLSMGGYGALLIAFKHPELFAGVAAHSAALFEELPQAPPAPADRLAAFRYALATRLFGTPPDEEHFRANSPLHLARANAAELKGLKIYFDVGESDRYNFQPGNRKLSEILTASGVRHEFHLAPGPHGWAFLAARAEPAMSFVWNAFGR